MTTGRPVRKPSRARVVWTFVGAFGGALIVFFIGVGAGAAGSAPDGTVAATHAATVTVTATASVTVTARPNKHRHRSTKQATHRPRSTPTATHHHAKRPSPTRTRTSAPVQHGVHPGAFCSPHGAIGYTDKGTRMRCSTKAGDPYWRWRSAG